MPLPIIKPPDEFDELYLTDPKKHNPSPRKQNPPPKKQFIPFTDYNPNINSKGKNVKNRLVRESYQNDLISMERQKAIETIQRLGNIEL